MEALVAAQHSEPVVEMVGEAEGALAEGLTLERLAESPPRPAAARHCADDMARPPLAI